MKAIRTLLIAALLIPALPAHAADEPSDSSLGHVLTLVHMFVRIAAEADSSGVSLRAIDEVLAGRNAAANEAIAGLLKEALADVSPENRATIAAIGRDLVGVARKNLLGLKPGETLFPGPLAPGAQGAQRHGPHVPRLQAVPRRGEAQRHARGGAVHRRRGVDLTATDFWGRDAVDFARRNNNEPLAQLILRSRPAAR